MALVKPAYTSTVNGLPTPVDTGADSVAANGFYPQNSATPNTSQSVTVDGSGNLVFTDVPTGAKTLAQLAAGGGGTDSIAITAFTAIPLIVGVYPVNVTTDGALDWYSGFGLTNSVGDSNPYYKINGTDEIHNTFHWIQKAGNAFARSGSAWALAVSDSVSGTVPVPAPASALDSEINTGGSSFLGYGYRFCAPAGATTRTLKLYTSCYQADSTLTVTLPSGMSSTYTLTTALGLTKYAVITVVYSSAVPGLLRASFLATADYGVSNIKFGAFTLS